jgi:hypothetical protein
MRAAEVLLALRDGLGRSIFELCWSVEQHKTGRIGHDAEIMHVSLVMLASRTPAPPVAFANIESSLSIGTQLDELLP